MVWRFGKRQLSDVVKVQQFLEKEEIDYELLLDHIDLQVGKEEIADPKISKAEIDARREELGLSPVTTNSNVDPNWQQTPNGPCGKCGSPHPVDGACPCGCHVGLPV